MPQPDAGVAVCCLRRGGHAFAFFSSVATFGMPPDIVAADIAIESVVPAGPDTAAGSPNGRVRAIGHGNEARCMAWLGCMSVSGTRLSTRPLYRAYMLARLA